MIGKWLDNIYRLGVKELISLRYDVVLVIGILYVFTFAIYIPAKTTGLELRNASIAIVDEDDSALSARIRDAFLEPYFLKPERLAPSEIDAAMDSGRQTFVIDIPPEFQSDVVSGCGPQLQVNVDATAISQAEIGAKYIETIVAGQLMEHVLGRQQETVQPVGISVRVRFNPNLKSSWFMGIMQIISGITLLSVVLPAAALLREREHGTIDHLLVMPLSPTEIVLAKVWANGLVIVIAATVSLWLIVGGVLQVPLRGSIALFVFGTMLYLFSTTAIGVFLATVARTMPQLGLLQIPVVVPMLVLSGGITPLESMPAVLQTIMHLSPSTHFVKFATAILFRGAAFEVVWPQFAAIAAIGGVFLVGALLRFRKTVTMT